MKQQKKQVSHRRKAAPRRPRPLWQVILADALALGVALLAFVLFHHALPRQEKAVGTVSQRSAVATPTAQPTATPAPTMETIQSAAPTVTPQPTATATPDPVGYFGNVHKGKFSDGEVIKEEDRYISSNLRVILREYEEYDSRVYFADIYVKDISSLQTAFGNGKFGRNQSEEVEDMARDHDAIVAINGDFYGMREDGVVIRNGVLYREDASPNRDVCVIYWDGSMEIFPAGKFDAQAQMERGAYQAWCFGPGLLNERGEPLTEFKSAVKDGNPRAAIGYFRPGHYAFVVVDGRNKYSEGVTMAELSKIMASLGCEKAYNLDGGATAAMFYGNGIINNPSNGGRNVSDIIMIVEPEA